MQTNTVTPMNIDDELRQAGEHKVSVEELTEHLHDLAAQSERTQICGSLDDVQQQALTDARAKLPAYEAILAKEDFMRLDPKMQAAYRARVQAAVDQHLADAAVRLHYHLARLEDVFRGNTELTEGLLFNARSIDESLVMELNEQALETAKASHTPFFYITVGGVRRSYAFRWYEDKKLGMVTARLVNLLNEWKGRRAAANNAHYAPVDRALHHYVVPKYGNIWRLAAGEEGVVKGFVPEGGVEGVPACKGWVIMSVIGKKKAAEYGLTLHENQAAMLVAAVNIPEWPISSFLAKMAGSRKPASGLLQAGDVIEVGPYPFTIKTKYADPVFKDLKGPRMVWEMLIAALRNQEDRRNDRRQDNRGTDRRQAPKSEGSSNQPETSPGAADASPSANTKPAAEDVSQQPYDAGTERNRRKTHREQTNRTDKVTKGSKRGSKEKGGGRNMTRELHP